MKACPRESGETLKRVSLMKQTSSFLLLLAASVMIVAVYHSWPYLYDRFHGYKQCPAGTHTARHTVDTYDLSLLGGGVGVAGHKIGDVIPVEGMCWPDDKPNG